jgi:tetratricopeptide (TPR) repeat protein
MRNRKWLLPLLITLLLASGFLPFVFSGYSELAKADQDFESGNYEQAAEAYARAARLLPWRSDLLEKAGISAGAAGDSSTAILHLERTPELSEQGWISLGYAYFTSGDADAALHAYQSGLEAYPSSASLYELVALIHRSQKDWPAERAALQNQILFDIDNVHAHYRLGLLLTLLEPEQALTELLFASSLDPEFAPAVQTLRAALDLSAAEPDASAHMVTIGRALGLVQEWDLALAAFEDAIELDAENAEAWAWLGEAKQQTGDALSVSKGWLGRVELDRALSLNRQSVIVRALRGLYWSRQGKYEQMLAEYLLAAEYEPTNPAWRASIGDAYLKLGDLNSALTAYQRATELTPDESTYWRLLAVFCAENGVHVEDVGLPAAQKAVDLAPDDLAALDTLGWLYASSGRYYTAEQTLLDVISRDPNYLPAHLHLATNYLAQGNAAPAYNELVFVRDADPNGANGQIAEEMLKRYFP